MPERSTLTIKLVYVWYVVFTIHLSFLLILKWRQNNELRMTLPPKWTWIEDQQLAGQGQDRPSKPTLVKSSLGWPLLFAKPSAKALPGQNLRVGGVSVEKRWERPKGHSSRIWKTRNLELRWLGTSFDIPFNCVILLFAVSPDLSSLWKCPNLSQIFWFWKCFQSGNLQWHFADWK